MNGKNNCLILIMIISGLVAMSIGCAALGLSPRVRFSPDRPIISNDLAPFDDKRGVLLAVKEPATDPGLGSFFGTLLFDELMRAAPFEHVAYKPKDKWFGLQSSSDEEFSTAAALGAELGYDVVILCSVERFIYSRNSESMMVVYLWLIETNTGEMIHAQRLQAVGDIGYVPPVWDPSLNESVTPEDMVAAAANELVRRLWWKAGIFEEEDEDY
jgi:hypothetical protein